MILMNLSDFSVATVKNADYRAYISNINKKEAVNILNSYKLGDKGVL